MTHPNGSLCLCTRGKPGCPFLNEEHFDAHLTQRGRLQAAGAGSCLLQTASPPEVVFVSPLSRTLQTATIALSKCPNLKAPVLAEESIRERNGTHPCDKRSPREHVEATYPTVDFSRIQYGPDPLWTEARETEDDLAARGKQFFASLMDRPETTFAIFTHSSFLFNTINRSFVASDPKGKFTSTQRTLVYIF
ncbi:Histidine phosphatase [Gracilaria domingensis]|nr:Histidine phosphatase [Gracilaria domingensis]